MRELWEMRYLWQVPMRLDNTKLVSILGNEPHTPAEEAVRASLTGLERRALS
jgi:nucleoside-diphosphate-sugar epimerase